MYLYFLSVRVRYCTGFIVGKYVINPILTVYEGITGEP